MKHPDPVSITGVGLTSSLGHSYQEFAANLLSRVSGIERVSAFDVTDHPSQIASLIERIPCPDGYDESEFRAGSGVPNPPCAMRAGINGLRDCGSDLSWAWVQNGCRVGKWIIAAAVVGPSIPPQNPQD